MPKVSKNNIGVCWERVNSTVFKKFGKPNPEKIFQQVWNNENSPRPGINRGLGTAQELFIVTKKSAELFNGPDRDDLKSFDPHSFQEEIWVYKLKPREHRIIATFVQWLGTSCGFGFLNNALHQCGYYIGEIQKYQEPEEDLHQRDRYTIMKKVLKRSSPIMAIDDVIDLTLDQVNMYPPDEESSIKGYIKHVRCEGARFHVTFWDSDA